MTTPEFCFSRFIREFDSTFMSSLGDGTSKEFRLAGYFGLTAAFWLSGSLSKEILPASLAFPTKEDRLCFCASLDAFGVVRSSVTAGISFRRSSLYHIYIIEGFREKEYSYSIFCTRKRASLAYLGKWTRALSISWLAMIWLGPVWPSCCWTVSSSRT